MTALRVAPCSYAAAKYAISRWHYSRRMPTSRSAMYGVWEDGTFIGAVVFGWGASGNLGKRYGLAAGQFAELVRVALTRHASPVSQIVAAALAQLKKNNPGLRLVISFADPAQGHHGGIYQAGNWLYLGRGRSHVYRINGTIMHPRRSRHLYGESCGQSLQWLRLNVDPAAERIAVASKHRYVYPLDRAMRRQVQKLAKLYPARLADEVSMVTR
jgi:hypothetical protein